ncbi:ABC transporter permease subunit [Azospirillum formosense]|uniref:ABC transporter permease subunit n=1 Tax=Azospirillum formosense TaxID=861533 RepID=A0ABX2KZY2_9PROT|nr:ABC transporter permease [Azospirillum formosense]MBY3754636.1 ABC transporter permease [Azospirillum formosense]NUB22131.1 ABC transporter permease subunit [Azospirillum formosense]
MTSVTEASTLSAAEAMRARRKARLAHGLNRTAATLQIVGLGWLSPLLRMAAGDSPRQQGRELWQQMGVPLTALMLFLAAWAWLAPQVNTSLGAIPGPAQVWEQVGVLHADHKAERAKEAAFYDRQAKRNAELLAKDPSAEVKTRPYAGKPTYLDQIVTSLKTVFTGFLLGALVAVPLGVACGLSRTVNAAMNPLIQIFKPVSPLAWLPLVTMVVSATVSSDNPTFEKSFLTSAITVTLCSLWPTLINTAVGVSSIDKDLMNVGKVLQLSGPTMVRRLVLPSALPYIFTGLRLSLGVGWMVLIAAEMLAQNPGLGKFVWDEFQNGSSSSLARIMVAVFTIGLIGFLLDRVMLAFQAAVSHTGTR